MSKGTRTRTINVNYLARVEGEGALYIKARNGHIQELRLTIFEPPRFFEAFLRGRRYSEAPDITARICGICPVAYQMSAVHAMEDIFGVRVTGPLRELRRLLYCGEWIESHALHVLMLHAPDFLGYQSVIEMAQDHPDIVQKGLLLKRTGNDLVEFIGGREIHPINVRVGGFYSVPKRKELLPFEDRLEQARDIAVELVRWVGSFTFPEFEQDYEFVALRHPEEYPLNEGRIVSNKGIDIAVNEYDTVFEEYQVPHSTALHSRVRGRGAYMVGPLARFNLNFDQLTPTAQEVAKELGFPLPYRNPFMSIIARSVELVYACEEALRIIREYEEPERPYVDYEVRAGTGHGCTEAPRGILYHRYTVDDEGVIQDARIVPPTAQNLHQIEQDLYRYAPQVLSLPREQATWLCEQAIRNYDPCISCSAHFLRLEIEEETAPP